MPTILLFPYLPLSQRCTVGPWILIPRRAFTSKDAVDEVEAEIISQLCDLYQLDKDAEMFGSLARPEPSASSADFEPTLMTPLHRAVLAGVLESNPPITPGTTGSASGHLVCSAENATLYAHPVSAPGAVVSIQTGAMLQTLTAIPLGLPPGHVKPPTDLPRPLALRRLDAQYADGVHRAVVTETQEGRRLGLTIDWLGLAWTNTPSMTEALRIVALFTGFESAVGLEGMTEVRSAVARLIDPDPTGRQHRSWTGRRGQPQAAEMSDFEWWFTCLSFLRNAIIHGDDSARAQYEFEGQRHLWLAEGHLRRLVRTLVAHITGDSRLLLSEMDRALEMAADAFLRDISPRQESPADSDGE